MSLSDDKQADVIGVFNTTSRYLYDILNINNVYFDNMVVYISQLIRFARASSYITDFNTRNKLLTQKLLKQGYRYHKPHKPFFLNFKDDTMI